MYKCWIKCVFHDKLSKKWQTKEKEKYNLAKDPKRVVLGIHHCQKTSGDFSRIFGPSVQTDGSQVTIAPNQITFSSMLPMIPSYNWPLVLDLCSLSRCMDIGMDRVSFDAAIRMNRRVGKRQDGTFEGGITLEGMKLHLHYGCWPWQLISQEKGLESSPHHRYTV